MSRSGIGAKFQCWRPFEAAEPILPENPAETVAEIRLLSLVLLLHGIQDDALNAKSYSVLR